MDLFCFASRNTRNIEIGIEHRLWAVATLLHQSSMEARITKARRNLHEGARGLLYCNPLHAFTTPFIVRSRADPDRVVEHVWPEPWRLPFRIEPLGDLSRRLPGHEAIERWPFLKNRLKPIGGVTAALNITGTTVFVPVTITHADWDLVCADLATTNVAS